MALSFATQTKSLLLIFQMERIIGHFVKTTSQNYRHGNTMLKYGQSFALCSQRSFPTDSS